MKTFLGKIFAFSIPLFLMLTAILLLNIYCADFTIDKNSNILVLGNSRPECAINDKRVAGLINLSESGESYFYTFHKMRKLVEQNKQIDTILIEFSGSQISKRSDKWIWGSMFMSHRFPQYALFMDFESIKLLARENPECFKSNLTSVVRNGIKMLLKSFNYKHSAGGYFPLYGSRINRNTKSKTLNGDNDSKLNLLSEINLNYLLKITRYCQENDLSIFLIRSPIHQSYQPSLSESFLMKTLQTHFPGVEFLDFSNYLLSDTDFFNAHHLNYKGASKFSDGLNALIGSGLLTAENKQEMIDSHWGSNTAIE